MALVLRHVIFEPFFTAPLLLILSRNSPLPEWRDVILQRLTSSPLRLGPSTVVTIVAWFLVIGVVGRVNRLLNAWALNNWKFGSAGGKEWLWPKEIAVVTGGSGGIGSELIKKLRGRGVHCVIMDLQPPKSDLAQYRNVHFYECDITNPTNVSEVAAKIKSEVGNPTVLVNNAGIGRTYTILDVPNEYLEKIMHINLISHWYTVKEFLPAMIEGKKGHIVTIASMASYTSVAGMVDYCVSKAGAMSFHEGLTQELKYRYNAPYIKTTSIHPYWVRTGLLGEWEETLDRLRNPIMTPSYVASQIARAIFSEKSGQVNLPRALAPASGARGWPHWMHALINDSTRKVTLANSTDAKQVKKET